MWASLSRNKRIIITILGVVLVFVVIPLVIYSVASRSQSSGAPTTDTIIIDNQGSFSSGIDPQVFVGLARAAYVVTTHNIKNPASSYHGVIRGSTFKNAALSSVSFVLDIPSLKISWSMSQALDEDGAPQSDAAAACVTKDQAIYPLLASCIDQNSGGLTPAQSGLLDISKILPLTGPTYSAVLGDTSDPTKPVPIIVTYYGNTGQQDAIDAIRSLGYDPDDYAFSFINGAN